MIPPGYSTYVIYSCINMSYAPRQSRAQSQTSQSCSGPAAAVSSFTRRRFPYSAGQRPLSTPGLSLFATSSASEAAASGERSQSRFHREAFWQIGKASSDWCPGGRLVLERVRKPGVIGAATLELENLALRHQIAVLQRSARKRPKLTAGDRLLCLLAVVYCECPSKSPSKSAKS